jgi:uncharacterized protein
MNDRENISRLLSEKKQELVEKYHLRSIGIFGSVNRDDFRPDSDIDILVDFDEPIGVEFIDLAEELEKILERRVDLVSGKGVKPKYLKEIQKDLVYV